MSNITSKKIISKLEFYKKANLIETRLSNILLFNLGIKVPPEQQDINMLWFIDKRKTKILDSLDSFMDSIGKIVIDQESDIITVDRKINSVIDSIEKCSILENKICSTIKVLNLNYSRYAETLTLINECQQLLIAAYNDIVNKATYSSKKRRIFMLGNYNFKNFDIVPKANKEYYNSKYTPNVNKPDQTTDLLGPSFLQKQLNDYKIDINLEENKTTAFEFISEAAIKDVLTMFVNNPSNISIEVEKANNRYKNNVGSLIYSRVSELYTDYLSKIDHVYVNSDTFRQIQNNYFNKMYETCKNSLNDDEIEFNDKDFEEDINKNDDEFYESDFESYKESQYKPIGVIRK